jgi:phosphoglycolate phosphatase
MRSATPQARLVVFDVDGTLVDSQDAIVGAMRAAFDGVGAAAPGAGDDPLHRRALAAGGDGAAGARADAGGRAARWSPATSATHFLAEPGRRARRGDSAALPGRAGRARRARRRCAGHAARRRDRQGPRGPRRICSPLHGARRLFRDAQTADGNPSKPHPGDAARRARRDRLRRRSARSWSATPSSTSRMGRAAGLRHRRGRLGLPPGRAAARRRGRPHRRRFRRGRPRSRPRRRGVVTCRSPGSGREARVAAEDAEEELRRPASTRGPLSTPAAQPRCGSRAGALAAGIAAEWNAVTDTAASSPRRCPSPASRQRGHRQGRARRPPRSPRPRRRLWRDRPPLLPGRSARRHSGRRQAALWDPLARLVGPRPSARRSSPPPGIVHRPQPETSLVAGSARPSRRASPFRPRGAG